MAAGPTLYLQEEDAMEKRDFKDVKDTEICEAFDGMASDLMALDPRGRVYVADAADAVMNHFDIRGDVSHSDRRGDYERVQAVIRETYNAKGRDYVVLG